METTQTILGSGGIIAREASYCLSQFSTHTRQVSRKPKKVLDTDQIFPADLCRESDVRAAVKGSDIVYLTVGLPYHTKIWQECWPKIMKYTINACQESGAKLVFFDNVYMYGKVDGWMTEKTPFNPCSKKGEVRAKITRQLLEEVQQGNIEALIARSADFYGPKAGNTYLGPMIFDKLWAGKKPQLMLKADKKHSYSYTLVAARGMVILGNTATAYGQTWHLPTDQVVLTGAEFIELAAREFGQSKKYSVLSPSMINMAALFSSVVRESKEMMYQFDDDYLFESSKFETDFFKATSYADAIRTIYENQYRCEAKSK